MFLKAKFQCSDLWVTSHDTPSDFYLCAWQRGCSPWPQLATRAVLAAAAVGVLTWSLTSGGSGASPYWLINLTNWGLVLVAATLLSGLLVSCLAAYKRPPDAAGTSWCAALYWALFTASQTMALAITILYWLLLYDPAAMVYGSRAGLWLDIATHAFNSVLTLAELLLARTPLRWPHVYLPLTLAVVYVAFSGVYYAAGGTNMLGEPFIYPVLDWRAAGAAGAVAAGSLAGAVLLHTLLWGLAGARTALARRLLRHSHSHKTKPRDVTAP